MRADVKKYKTIAKSWGFKEPIELKNPTREDLVEEFEKCRFLVFLSMIIEEKSNYDN